MAQAASSITGMEWRLAIATMRQQVARHAKLVHAQYRLGARRDRALDQLMIDVVAVGLDIDEDRRPRRNSGWRWPSR